MIEGKEKDPRVAEPSAVDFHTQPILCRRFKMKQEGIIGHISLGPDPRVSEPRVSFSDNQISDFQLDLLGQVL